MTPLTEDLEGLREKYLQDWLKAEAVVKQAELISGVVVMSSVNELRYAGRRFVDFLLGQDDNRPVEELRVHLIEAVENCRKARHDAVDAALFHISREWRGFMDRAGRDVVAMHFPHYYDLNKELQKVKHLVTSSRRDRPNLDQYYEQLEGECLSAMNGFWDELQLCRGVITAYRSRQRRDFWIGVVSVGLLVGILAAAVVTVLDKQHAFDFLTRPSAESQKLEAPKSSIKPNPSAEPK